MEQEKRIRREIANSNERRRMQSINSGFQSLKLMIPHQDGEKVSKVYKYITVASYQESPHIKTSPKSADLNEEMFKLFWLMVLLCGHR